MMFLNFRSMYPYNFHSLHPTASQQKNRINDDLGSGCSSADVRGDTFNKYVAEQEKVEENRDDARTDVCADNPVA